MSHFAKRHYQQLALIMQGAEQHIQENDDVTASELRSFFIDQLCLTFSDDNGQFNEALFRQACQSGQNVRARKVA